MENPALTVLITRPESESIALEQEVVALGYGVMIEPLLAIQPVDHPDPELENVQVLVLTSANAIPALPERAKKFPIYTVGEATAAAAKAAGCTQVCASKGNVRDLSKLIVENCRSEDGTILHLTGEVIREGLAETLIDHGFHYRRLVTYNAVARTQFSRQVVDAWRQRSIGAVLLFSPRTSEVLVDLLRAHNLERNVDSATAVCLSQETATPCNDLVWRSIRIAARPNRQALLEQLVGSIAVC